MSAPWAAVLVASVVAGGGWIWNAGKLAAVLRQLTKIAEDHEARIRLLEGDRHAVGGRHR